MAVSCRKEGLIPRLLKLTKTAMFPALYNCLYSCCWLIGAMLDFDILCEHIRIGAPPPDDHPLVKERIFIDGVADRLSRRPRS